MNEVSRRLWSEEVRVDLEGLTCVCRDFGGCGEGASQFIDIQGFDLVTTRMSQGLRQPRLSPLSPLQKAEGSPAARSPPRGCHGEHGERAALRHSHVGAFFSPPALCSEPRRGRPAFPTQWPAGRESLPPGPGLPRALWG